MISKKPIAIPGPLVYSFFCLTALLLGQARMLAAPGQGEQLHPSHSQPTECPDLVVCSPDGEFYVTAAQDGRLKYCRSEDGKTLRTFYICSPRSLIFSRDGRLLVCVGGFEKISGAVRVWNLSSGRPLCSFQTSLAEVPLLAISADGSLLALTTGPRRVSLYELPEGKARWSVALKSTVTNLSFPQHHGAVLVQCDDNSLVTLALANGQRVETGSPSSTAQASTPPRPSEPAPAINRDTKD